MQQFDLLRRCVGQAGIVLLLALLPLPDADANPPTIPRSSLSQIERLLSEDDPQLQRTALHDLTYIEGGLTKDLSRLFPRVLELCGSENNDVVVASLSVAKCFLYSQEVRHEHGPAVVKAIGDACKSDSPSVRFSAVHTLGPVLAKEQIELALPILISSAADKDETVRMWSLVTLGSVGNPDPGVITTLRKALADPATHVRSAAASALANSALASKDAIPELLVAARDQSGVVSASAIDALVQIGVPAFEPLLELAADPIPSVRKFAMNRLWSNAMTSGVTADQFRQIKLIVRQNLADPDPSVRLAAAINVSLAGDLESRALAAPILASNSDFDESVDTRNAYLGVARCINEFVVGLSQEASAEIGFSALLQFDRDFLRAYLLEYHGRIRAINGINLRSVFQEAEVGGIKAEHRQFATEVLTWF